MITQDNERRLSQTILPQLTEKTSNTTSTVFWIMIGKRTEHYFKVSVFIVLAVASMGLFSQANIYGQFGSQGQSRLIFLADLEPRTGSNATGIAAF